MAGADAPVRFEILGPLRAWRDVDAVPLGPIQEQVVLAVLLLHANRPLSRPAEPSFVMSYPPDRWLRLHRVAAVPFCDG